VTFGAFHVTLTAFDRARTFTDWGAVNEPDGDVELALGVGVDDALEPVPTTTLTLGDDGKLEPKDETVRTCT
jgi:hypothetical protein